MYSIMRCYLDTYSGVNRYPHAANLAIEECLQANHGFRHTNHSSRATQEPSRNTEFIGFRLVLTHITARRCISLSQFGHIVEAFSVGGSDIKSRAIEPFWFWCIYARSKAKTTGQVIFITGQYADELPAISEKRWRYSHIN